MKCSACRRELKHDSPTGMGPVCSRRAGVAPRQQAATETHPGQASLFQPEGEENVTIDEAVKARQELEDEILALLVKYRNASGLTPTGVEVHTSGVEQIGGRRDVLLQGVRVLVEV